ncbi:hypothetical protein CRUP_017925, partial [Coryphaenoides rupestris]
MWVFPRISLRPEVHDHLERIFLNKELLAAVGRPEAERQFQRLLQCLSHPPGYTCVRASTHLAPLEEIRGRLAEELQQQQQRNGSAADVSVEIQQHPVIPDVLLLPVIGPRAVVPLGSEVVVGAQCGSAVLRGAHVFAPGILATPKSMRPGDTVSVFSDVDGRCTRGSKLFQGNTVFVGNGVSEMHRAAIFSQEPARGIGVRMTDPLYQSPSFDGGEVVALDRIRSKMASILQNVGSGASDALTSDPTLLDTGGPPFPPGSFDRVLLDAPCSSLGQRPSMAL